MTPEERQKKEARIALLRKKLRVEELKEKIASHKMSYDEATKGEVAAEVGRSVVRGGGYAAEGFADIYDIARASVDQLAPESWGVEDRSVMDQINPFAPPDKGDIAREKFAKDTGLDEWGKEKIRRGDNALLDMTKTASEYIMPVVTGGGLGGLKQTAKNIAKIGGGAAVGEQVGGETGEMIGALTSGVASRATLDRGKQLFNKYFKGDPNHLSDMDIEDALQAIMLHADDPEKAKANFLKALENGEKGTFADLCKDRGIYNVEAMAQAGTSAGNKLNVAQEQRNAQMEQRIGDQFDDHAYVNPDQPGQVGRDVLTGKIQERRGLRDESIAGAERLAAAGLTQSRAKVEGATSDLMDAERLNADAINTGGNFTPPSAASEKLSNTYALTEKADDVRNVRPVWAPFNDPNLPPIDVANIVPMVRAELAKMNSAKRKGIEKHFANELKLLDDMNPATGEHPNEVQGVIDLIKGKLTNIDAAKTYTREMVQINKKLEKFLQDSAAGGMYKAGQAATKKHKDKFEPGSVGDARRKTTDGRLLMANMGENLEKGAVTAAEIKQSGSPAVIKTFKQTMMSLATREEGLGRLDAFINKHDELLSAFPDLRDQVHTLQRANKRLDTQVKATKDIHKVEATAQKDMAGTLKQARKAANAKATKGTKALYASVLGDFADKPQKSITKILNDENGPDMMKRLINDVGKTPKDRANLKSLIGQQFLEGISRTEGTINPATVAQFKKMRGTLEADGIMSGPELDVIADVLDLTEGTAMRRGASPIKHDFSRHDKIASALVATAMLKFLPGNSLLLSGTTRDWFKEAVLKVGDPQITKALDTMIGDAGRFEEAVKKFKPASEVDMKNMLTSMLKDAQNQTIGVVVPATMVQAGNEQTYSRE